MTALSDGPQRLQGPTDRLRSLPTAPPATDCRLSADRPPDLFPDDRPFAVCDSSPRRRPM